MCGRTCAAEPAVPLNVSICGCVGVWVGREEGREKSVHKCVGVWVGVGIGRGEEGKGKCVCACVRV